MSIRKNILVRFFYSLVLFLSVLFFPWWMVVSLSLFGAMMFEDWYECVIAGICMDILYGTQAVSIVGLPVFFTAIGFVLLGVNRVFNKIVRV